jgi:hypothetical protein
MERNMTWREQRELQRSEAMDRAGNRARAWLFVGALVAVTLIEALMGAAK